MSVRRLQIFVFILAIGFLGVACDDSSTDPGSETTVEEDKQNIQNATEDASGMVTQIENGDFVAMTESFTGGNLQGEASAEWAFPMLEELEQVTSTESIENNNRFEFSANTGLYEWNPQDSVWDKSSSDAIIFEFPGSADADENNASLSLSDYSDAAVNTGGEDYYLPTSFLLEASKNGESTFRFDLNALEFIDDSDMLIPSTADLEIFTAPATHALNFNREENTRFSFSYETSVDEESMIGLSVAATFSHDDYANLDEGDLELLEGTFTLASSLRIDYSAEVGELAGIDDPSASQLNQYTSAELYYDDNRVGDIEFDGEMEQLVIVFSDGSSEPLQKYLQNLMGSQQQQKLDLTTVTQSLDVLNTVKNVITYQLGL